MFMHSVLSKFCAVFLLFQIVASDQRNPSDGIAVHEWPCPIAESIAPCVCTSDENYALSLDCSGAETIDELANAFKAEFPFKEFDKLTIKQSDCASCSITSLPAGVFGYDVSFKIIEIAGTQIEVIEEQVFSGSHETLVELRLSANKISSFPFESLGSYKVLGYLYLNSNQIEVDSAIPDMVFEKLIIINLSSNKIIVSPGLVSNSPSIKQVRLRNTQQTSVPVFDESPISMFRGLQYIDLVDFGANKITEIPTGAVVSDASTLKTVDFSRNEISNLSPGFVSGFSSNPTSTLIMSYNSIVHLYQDVWEDIFNELPQENSIDISENPLRCGCDVQWLIQSPLKKSLTNTTTCEDGVSIVKYLPEEAFLVNC